MKAVLCLLGLLGLTACVRLDFQTMQARQRMLDSNAAYTQCLARAGDCSREKAIYEADLRALGPGEVNVNMKGR